MLDNQAPHGLYNAHMEKASDTERFQEIIALLDELPPGIDDALRDELLQELDNLEYKAALGLLAGPDPDDD